VELQSRYADITKQGLGLIAISYDSPETLKKFTASRSITFPLIADSGSAIIKAYGLLNQGVDPQSTTYGIPHPGTFIVDRKGVWCRGSSRTRTRSVTRRRPFSRRWVPRLVAAAWKRRPRT